MKHFKTCNQLAVLLTATALGFSVSAPQRPEAQLVKSSELTSKLSLRFDNQAPLAHMLSLASKSAPASSSLTADQLNERSLEQAKFDPTRNRIHYLPYGGQAFSALVESIDSAKSSIDVMYYLFEYKHSTGRMFMAHLVQAAVRNRSNPNFKIRILLDAYAQSTEDQQNLRAYFGAYGIDIRFMNDSITPRANNRNHIKFTLVDSNELTTGSRNIADYHYGMMGDPGGPHWTTWFDKDAMVTGPAAASAKPIFEQFWQSSFISYPRKAPTAEALKDWHASSVVYNDREKKLEALLKLERHKYDREFPVIQCQQISFVADEPNFMYKFPSSNDGGSFFESGGDANPMYSHKRTSKAVVDFIRGTKTHLFVENYSFQPVNRLATAFKELKSSNIPIYLVTNEIQDTPEMTDLTRRYTNAFQGGTFSASLFTGDAPHGEMWFRTEGVDVKVHSKIFARDGVDSLISTFNIDGRSYSTNWEAGLLVENCPEFAKRIEYDIMRTFKTGKSPANAAPYSSSFTNKVLEDFY